MDRPASRVPQLVRLRVAKDELDRSFARPLDIAELAALAGYSRFHFIRAFRATYGETPGRYLARRRVERARDLLASANLTVTEVAGLVGFASLGTFSSRFRAQVGMSPSAYRRAVAAQGGPPPVPGCFVLMWHGGGAQVQDRNRGEAGSPHPS